MIELGELVYTIGVASEIENKRLTVGDLHSILSRHSSGEDWGELCQQDKATNDEALKNGERLLSSYTVKGIKLWVITEADRSATTILLPDEY